MINNNSLHNISERESLELNKIYNMDCLEGMKLIHDNSVDLCVIDPPYKLTAGGMKNTKIGGLIGREGNDLAKQGKIFEHNDIEFKDYFKEIYRVLKDGSHFYCMCNDKHLKNVLIEGENAKFKELNILAWNKGMHTPMKYYMKNIEFIVLFRKGRAKNINNLGSFSLIDIKGIRGNKIHPSEKPIELFNHFIENSSNENEIVLDLFMGSGTTAMSCLETNRNYIGFELDKNYYDISNERINKVKLLTQ